MGIMVGTVVGVTVGITVGIMGDIVVSIAVVIVVDIMVVDIAEGIPAGYMSICKTQPCTSHQRQLKISKTVSIISKADFWPRTLLCRLSIITPAWLCGFFHILTKSLVALSAQQHRMGILAGAGTGGWVGSLSSSSPWGQRDAVFSQLRTLGGIRMRPQC